MAFRQRYRSYPLQEFDRANKIALVGLQDGWIKDYVLQSYINWFQGGLEAGGDENLAKHVAVLSLNMDDIIARSQSQEIDELYKSRRSAPRIKEYLEVPVLSLVARFFGEMIGWKTQ